MHFCTLYLQKFKISIKKMEININKILAYDKTVTLHLIIFLTTYPTVMGGETGSFQRDDVALHIKSRNLVWRTEMCEGRRAIMAGFFDTHMFFYVFVFCTFSSLCSGLSSLPSSCKLRKKFLLNEVHKPGDVVLGGLFAVHPTSVFPDWTFTSEPQRPSCKGWVFPHMQLNWVLPVNWTAYDI